jgi:predicted AAA+ superfamily ATPase
MVFERNIYSKLSEHASQKQITILTGLRRTGKSTLVKQLLKVHFPNNSIYIDLERLDNRNLFNELNYNNVVLALTQRGINFNEKATIAIDEAQLLPNLPSVVKYLYDNFDIKFIVTGSSSYYLKNLFSESLAGRKKIFELYPLTFGEFLTFKSIIFTPSPFWTLPFQQHEYELLKGFYSEFISFGGMPEVVLTNANNSKADLLEDLVSSYINIDIKWLSDFKNAETIRNLLIMLVSRTATKLDYTKLSALTGLSIPTVTNYIELFEKTYLIHRLPVVSQNPDREIVKAKKVFACDNGILNCLAKVSSGVLFENAIFNQLKQLGELKYYSLKTGKEIDFIFDSNTAIEVKETATSNDLHLLQKLAKNLSIDNCKVISNNTPRNVDNVIWGGSIK